MSDNRIYSDHGKTFARVTVTEQLNLDSAALNITVAPTTSAGTYEILTRNASTGLLESVPSTTFSTIDDIPDISATYLTVIAAASGYQPLDGDLTSIAALVGTSGFLTKTAANTWALDTNTYLSSASAASTYQPLDGDLTAIAANTTNGLLKRTGTNTWTTVTDNSINWDTAYNDKIVSMAVTGTALKTITLNQQDGGTVTATFTDISSGSGAVQIGNSVYVSKDGDNALAQRERIDSPFSTIQAAVTAAVAGDTVIVHPGTYSESIVLKTGVNFYFYPGVILQASSGTAAITDNNVAVTSKIDGFGEIRATGTAGATATVNIQNTGSNVILRAKEIYGEYRGVDAKGTLIILSDITVSGTNEGIRLSGAACTLTYQGNITVTGSANTGGYGISASSSTPYANIVKISNSKITSNGNSALAVFGAHVEINNSHCLGTYYVGLETGSGRMIARNTVFESTGAVNNGFAWLDYTAVDSTNAYFKFDGCKFLATGSGTGAIGTQSAAGGRAPFYFTTSCFANRDPYAISGSAITYGYGKENLLIETLYKSHAPIDVADGFINQSFLGSGSAGGGTKFLADDQTWKTVAGGGGSQTLQQTTLLGNTTTDNIILEVTDPSIGVITDSPYLSIIGKGNNAGTVNKATWKQYVDMTTTSGLNYYRITKQFNVGAVENILTLGYDYSIAFYNATASAQYSIAFHGSTASGIGSIALSENAIVVGANSAQVGGQNTVIDSGVLGAFSGATDSHIYATADYAFIGGDANDAWGYASFIGGFGNDVYSEHGFASGHDNVVGAHVTDGTGTANLYNGEFALGGGNKITGNYSGAIGRALTVSGNNNITVGRGITTTEVDSFNVGFNSTIPTFKVSVATGSGTAGITTVAGALKINTITALGNDDSLSQVLVKAADGTVKYRSAATLGGGGGLASVQTGNTLYVSKDGNNATALRERLDLPFLTINAAVAAASSGDTVVVFPGIYEELARLKTELGVSYQFIGKGEVQLVTTSFDPVIGDNNTAGTCEIIAPGWTFTARNFQSCIEIYDPLTNVKIICKELKCQTGVGAIQMYDGTLTIEAEKVHNTATGQAIYYDGTGVVINAKIDTVQSVGDVAILGDSGSIYLVAKKIVKYDSVNADYLVYLLPATTSSVWIEADLIYTEKGWATYVQGSSTSCYIKAKRIQSGGTCTVVGGSSGMVSVQAQEIVNHRTTSPYGLIHAEGGNMTVIGARLVRLGGGGGADVKTSNLPTQGQLKLIGVSYDRTLITESAPNSVRRIDSHFQGDLTVYDGRFQLDKGIDVVAANDLTLGSDGNVFKITGSTQINAITTTNWQAGVTISLIFSAGVTVKHNTAGGAGTAPMLLSGSVDYVAAANGVLTLLYDGTNWQESSRKVA